MPTYIVHGFRWPRAKIRIHVILNNIDDAAPEWLVAPRTTAALLHKFRSLYPEVMTNLPNLRFIEQYDPLDETVSSQPFAFVCDVVHEVNLSADVGAITNRGISEKQWAAMAELRDELHSSADMGWHVVVCGDEERAVDNDDDEDSEDEDSPDEGPSRRPPPRSAPGSSMGRFGATSPKITQSTLPMRQETQRTISSSATNRPTTPSTSITRPKTPNDPRSPSSRAGPSSPGMSRTPTTDSPGRGKERDSEPRRVRFQHDDHDTIYPNTETDEQQRSSSLGKGLRKVFGLRESKSKSNIKKDEEDDDSPPPIPRKSRK